MPNRKISQFVTVATPLTGSEVIDFLQDGINKKGTVTDLLNHLSTQGFVIFKGNWDASVNAFPSVGVLKANQWRISVAGVLGGVELSPGAKIMALQDAPGQTLANWDIIF